MIGTNEVTEPGPAASLAACPVCNREVGASEIYFHAVVNGAETLVCPRCVWFLMEGITILEARARMNFTVEPG